MLCRVATVMNLPAHHHSAGYILFPLGSLSTSWLFENQIPLKPTLGGVCSLANYSVAYEETLVPVYTTADCFVTLAYN